MDNRKNIVIGILLTCNILLICTYIYFAFIKKETPCICESVSALKTINKLDKITLTNKNTEVKINNKLVKLKVVDSELYVNDKKMNNIFLEGTIFVTNEYVLVSPVGQCGYGITKAINEDGIIIDIINSEYQYENLKLDGGKLIATALVNCTCYDDCPSNYNVEFIYDGSSIKVQKMN